MSLIHACNAIQLQCKDLRLIQLIFPSTGRVNTKIEAYYSFLNGVIFAGVNSTEIFAFNFDKQFFVKSESKDFQWASSDIRDEYERQGLNESNNWRVNAVIIYKAVALTSSLRFTVMLILS